MNFEYVVNSSQSDGHIQSHIIYFEYWYSISYLQILSTKIFSETVKSKLIITLNKLVHQVIDILSEICYSIYQLPNLPICY